MPTYKQLLQKYYHLNYLDTELLLTHALKKTRAFLLTHLEDKASLKGYFIYQYYLWQYLRGYSVAAITRHKEFFGLDFYVNKNVLIPRPDTEIMVSEAINEMKKIENTTLIDIGVGSACVPISIAKNIDKKITITAADISCQALRIAKKNAQKHGVTIRFIDSNLLSKFKSELITDNHIVITANLPYLTTKQFAEELSIHREPKKALVAGENGLALYRKLLEQSKIIFSNKKLTLFFEIDPTQTKGIKKIILNNYPQARIEIKKDLSGLDRLVKIST